MKRFSAREFGLLCLPVAAVAGAGFWASRKPAPKPYAEPQLSLSYQAPTALEAFSGYKFVLVADLSKDSADTDYGIQLPNFWLDATTPQGTQTWRSDGKGSLAQENYAISIRNNNHFSVAMKEVPQGELNFGISGKADAQFTIKKSPAYSIDQNWNVERAKIKTFDFSLPRAPNLKVKYVKVSKVTAQKIVVDIPFLFLGSKDLAEMTWQEEYDEANGWFMMPSSGATQGTVRNRVANCMISTPAGGFPQFTLKAKPVPPVKLSGRVSADNHWPLAFKIEPFEFRKVKVGQKLKFKSWPAPLPPGTNK